MIVRVVALCLFFLTEISALAVSPPPVKPSIKKTGTAATSSKQTELPVLAAPPPAADKGEPSVRAHLDRAEKLAEKGEWEKAEEHLRAAIRLDPQHAEVVLLLAKVLMEQAKDDAALAVLAAYAGPDVRVTQALGEAYVGANQLKEAEQMFMDLSLRQPAESYHRYNLGLVEFRMGKFDMAEQAYLRAVELDPKFTDARYNLALLYIRNKDYPKALAQLEEAVRLREDPDYLINYGVVLRELNRFDASEAALERAVGIDPDNALALNNLGMTHYLAGNMEEAKRAFQGVLNVSPDDPTARSFLAKISAAPQASMEKKSKPPDVDRAPKESPKPPEPPAKVTKTEPQPDPDDDVLRRENKELKGRLEELEKKMDEIKRGVAKQVANEEKAQAERADAAIKKAQTRLEKKEKEMSEKKSQPADMDAPAGPVSGRPGPGLDDRLQELQQTLASARMELEEVRRQQGPVAFSPEPGSTEDRLDAADRAVQQLQRQIRQLTIERDMLRAEIGALRPGVPTSSRGPGGRTNVNLADLSGLLLVPGMEERLAHNVLWYRQNIGSYKSVLDLKKVPGMDEAHYAKMVDFISVGSEAAP